MKNNKNIDEILNQLDNINRVSPSERFLLSLEQKALKINYSGRTIKMKAVYGIAASLVLLIAINFKIVLDSNLGSNVELVDSYESGYTMIPTNTLYYE